MLQNIQNISLIRLHKNHFILFALSSLAIMSILTLGMYLNNNSIVLASFILTMLFMSMGKKENLFNYILFFIPSANIFKLSSGSFSLYTFICLFALLLFVTKYIKEIYYDKRQLIFILILACYSALHLFNRSFNMFEFAGFFADLVLVSILSFSKNKLINLKYNSIAFTLGVFSSSISGLILQHLPHMSVYFDIDTIYIAGTNMSRFVGLNQDPNFYSLQVAVALSLMLTVFIPKEGTMPITVKLTFITLSIFGFWTLSKTYLIIWCLILLCWFFSSLGKQTIKHLFILLIIFISIYVINIKYGVLDELINFYSFRFGGTGGANDLDTLTTGRAHIWEYYINEIKDPLTFLVGTGLDRNIRAVSPHNSYISVIYSFGAVGTILFISYLSFISWSLKINKKIKKQKFILRVLPLLVYLIFIGSLDLLFEDYFMILFLLLLNALQATKAKTV